MANNKRIRPHDAGCLPFSLANLDASGLGLASKFAFKNCKTQFYSKGRQTVSKQETTGIKEIQLVSFRPGNASAPGKFSDGTNWKVAVFHLLSNQILWKPFVKQWQ